MNFPTLILWSTRRSIEMILTLRLRYSIILATSMHLVQTHLVDWHQNLNFFIQSCHLGECKGFFGLRKGNRRNSTLSTSISRCYHIHIRFFLIGYRSLDNLLKCKNRDSLKSITIHHRWWNQPDRTLPQLFITTNSNLSLPYMFRVLVSIS